MGFGLIDVEVARLKKLCNAVILAHNYQVLEVQDLADFVGDSLGLSRYAMKSDAETIVFAGVDFMAEQASILNPDKRVLIPELASKCHMAYMLPRRLLLEFKRKHPNCPVVLYVNSLAEVKAEADYICTSANAVDVVSRIDADTILFGPDANLAHYVRVKTGKNIIAVPSYGHCYVHLSFTVEDIMEIKERHPDAVVLVHPECTPEVQGIADFIGSTSQMVRYAGESKHKTFIVATEVGLIDRMRRLYPGKEFIPANPQAICIYMKKISRQSILNSLKYRRIEVKVPEAIAKKAYNALMNTQKLLEG